MSKSDLYRQTGKTAVQQNVHGTMSLLLKYPPFNQMEASHLAYLVEHCQLRFYALGECIIQPSDGPVDQFFIVKQGLISGQRMLAGQDQPETTFEISVGECFPLAALIGERATRTAHMAGEDTFCLCLPKAHFVRLFSLSPPFRDFALRGVSSLLDQVNQQAQMQAAENLGAQYSLDTRLGELVMRQPVTCAPELPINQAVRRMHEHSVGSIAVMQAERLIGIFTLRDLRRVVAEDQINVAAPIAEAMTADPFHLSSSHSAFDAAIAMTTHHIAHICVVDQGQLLGMVSERDLFSLQRVDLVHLARTIRQASRISTLKALRSDIRHLVENMLAHGASSTQITHIVTLLNDHTVCRVIELCRQQFDLQDLPFTWLCFGSEGRREQTLHTDQDNGILFSASDATDAESKRRQLLPLAEKINQALAECGFTLCKGNIMAGNPALCLSLDEWRSKFQRMISEATPDNLLASSIYFDCRVVWGDELAAEGMFAEVMQNIRRNSVFQHLLAQNALRLRPPIGRIRDFVVARSGADKDTLDLKTQGLTPFVDAARLLSLAHGIRENNTLERFRLLSEQGVIDSKDAAAYEEAYHFIQLIRMQQHQRQDLEGKAFSNRIDPDSLNHLDRRILRESFRQAKRLQASLALRYNL
ncbi:putative nucleotidyltransferase substrate binding domain-containing protein [Halopseudomonas salegens]|uniref:CBS domain-containing protein n=1 Tax=Halopseudomonas salegens TaxID=1434072 RepID=A0A1H2FHF6_9GAMM|nr:putative nucleotidyltransferase substrate binding domain-containing protein [Halopseudomonas salegens]SDU06755.1 CBS domain-containing protein [Halopseudomonas salegens]